MPNPVPIQSDVDTDGRPRIASRVIFESSHDYRAYISQAGAFPAAALFGPMRSYAVLFSADPRLTHWLAAERGEPPRHSGPSSCLRFAAAQSVRP